MKFLPYLAANLWRRPIRTAFTLVSLVFGFTLLGLAFGLHASLRDMAKSARADRIYTSARFEGRMHLAQLERISRLRGVAQVGALDALAGYYRQPMNKIAVLMAGAGMRDVFPELPLTDRQWRLLAGTRDGVFLSQVLATKYALKAGSRLPIIAAGTPRTDGSAAWPFEVLGVLPDIPLMPVGFAVGNYEYLDQSRALSDRGDVGQFWVIAKDRVETDEVMKTIDDSFANSAAATQSVSEKALLENAGGSGSDSVLGIMAMALVGVVMIAFLTSNAIRHSIRERTRELAVLKTLGFSNANIARLILAEASTPCLAACAAGLCVAAVTAAILPSISPPGFVLPVPDVDGAVVGSAIGIALAIAMISAVLPVLRVTHLDVAAALARH
jgi:putative ABC transport system permease protein